MLLQLKRDVGFLKCFGDELGMMRHGGMLLWLGLLIGVNSGHGIDLHNSKCLDPIVDHGNTGSGGSSATVVEGLQNAEVDQVLHDAVSLLSQPPEFKRVAAQTDWPAVNAHHLYCLVPQSCAMRFIFGVTYRKNVRLHNSIDYGFALQH
jgi:hypothetical protein